MVSQIRLNIGSGNGLLPDSTKPLPKLILTYHPWGSVALTEDIAQEVMKISIRNLTLKNTQV